MSPFLLIKDAFNLFRSFTKCPPTGQDSFKCLNTSTHRMGVQGGSHRPPGFSSSSGCCSIFRVAFAQPLPNSRRPRFLGAMGGHRLFPPASLTAHLPGLSGSLAWTIIWTSLSPCFPTPQPQSIHYTSCHGDLSGIPI